MAFGENRLLEMVDYILLRGEFVEGFGVIMNRAVAVLVYLAAARLKFLGLRKLLIVYKYVAFIAAVNFPKLLGVLTIAINGADENFITIKQLIGIAHHLPRITRKKQIACVFGAGGFNIAISRNILRENISLLAVKVAAYY